MTPRTTAAQKVICLGGVNWRPEELVLELVVGTVLRLVDGADFGADDLLLDFGAVLAETVFDLGFGLDLVAIFSPQNNDDFLQAFFNSETKAN